QSSHRLDDTSCQVTPLSAFALTYSSPSIFSSFFFTDPATTEFYTLSLHDALPISVSEPPMPPLWMESGVHSCPVLKHQMMTGISDRKSTRLNSSHVAISYAVFCLKKKKNVYVI